MALVADRGFRRNLGTGKSLSFVSPMKQRSVAVALMLCAVSSCALAFLGLGNSMSWKEEVLLHDGSILVLERHYNLGGRPTLDSRERAAIDETVTFTLPGTNKAVSWKTDFRDSIPEPNGLNLLLVDIVGGMPYIATYPVGCIAYNKWKRPNPQYIVFKYEGGNWKHISLEEFPKELAMTNVIVGRPPGDLLKPFYKVADVQERNYYLPPEYKAILREPVKGAGANCGEMVYDGHGGWIGIGWFKKQPSLQACFKYCERENISPVYCPCESVFQVK